MLSKIKKLFIILCFTTKCLHAQETNYPLDIKSINLNLPNTDDPELSRILNDSKSIYYKLSPVWQHFVPQSKILEKNLTTGSATYKEKKAIWNIYSADYNPDSHANFNFPWETTVGLNSLKKEGNKNFNAINIINLPKDSNNNVIPIWVLNEIPTKWIFPAGTTVGEIIYVTNNGINYVQEIRTRTKSENCNYWEPNVYRPISNRKEYIELTNGNNYVPAMKHMFFRNPQEDEVYRMEGLVERLPPLPEDKVKFLLSQKFKNVTEENWSPSSIQEFHILPKDYCFSLIGSVDSDSCSNCHRQTQISVSNLVPKDPSVFNNFDGTGNIRGCDAVFTWHPFSSESIKSVASEDIAKPTLRNFDITNKIVTYEEPKDLKNYKITLFVQNALKKYELPKNNNVIHEEKKEGDDVVSSNKN